MMVGRDEDGNKGDEASFTLAQSPTHLLHRAQQLAASKSVNSLRRAKLTIRQFALLEALSENEGASQSQLVDLTAIDRSTLADMVARMERGGLISRDKSESDGRANTLRLTDVGSKALHIARPAVAEADEALLAVLPKNRRASFLAILSHMSDASDEMLLDLEPAEDGTDRKVRKKKKAESLKAGSDKGKAKKKKKKSK